MSPDKPMLATLDTSYNYTKQPHFSQRKGFSTQTTPAPLAPHDQFLLYAHNRADSPNQKQKHQPVTTANFIHKVYD